MITALTAGLGTGLSLIVAIGSQNAFVLRQGIRREHVLPIVLVCGVSDAVLIIGGITGIGGFLKLWPAALTVMGLLGGLFLIGYGFLAARRAFRPAELLPGSGSSGSRRTALLTVVALTWLNPHVYLDILLLGAVANSWDTARWWFGLGAVAGSLIWFSALGFGARALSGFFSRPASWRLLDGFVATTMTILGVALLVRSL